MSEPLHQAIELHDSELASVSQVGESVVLSFSSVCLHESSGAPGVDAGIGWYQPATLSVGDARIAASVRLPAAVSDGFLRVGDILHQNSIPATTGTLGGPIELSLLLSTSETLLVRGATITIELSGKPSPIEHFSL